VIIERTLSDAWRIDVDRHTTLVHARVGMPYLAQLLANPGRDIVAITLASDGRAVSEFGSTYPVLDPDAVRNYRRRARELKQLLNSDETRDAEAARYRDELSVLTGALRSTTGLGGRTRTFPEGQERARTAVRKALIRAIAAIEDSEPELAQHLNASVTTGYACRYSPAPEWEITVRTQADPTEQSTA